MAHAPHFVGRTSRRRIAAMVNITAQGELFLFRVVVIRKLTTGFDHFDIVDILVAQNHTRDFSAGVARCDGHSKARQNGF